jgi:hypothetical protein
MGAVVQSRNIAFMVCMQPMIELHCVSLERLTDRGVGEPFPGSIVKFCIRSPVI